MQFWKIIVRDGLRFAGQVSTHEATSALATDAPHRPGLRQLARRGRADTAVEDRSRVDRLAYERFQSVGGHGRIHYL